MVELEKYEQDLRETAQQYDILMTNFIDNLQKITSSREFFADHLKKINIEEIAEVAGVEKLAAQKIVRLLREKTKTLTFAPGNSNSLIGSHSGESDASAPIRPNELRKVLDAITNEIPISKGSLFST